MAQYIDKDALITKIEKRVKYNHERAYLDRSPFMAGREEEGKDILSIIDTLEVKEINSTDVLIEKSCKLLVNCIEDFMARRMEIWDEECKKQTLENLRKALKE